MSAPTPWRAAPDAGGAGPLPPGWHRLHPASPALRSWKLLVLLLLFYGQSRGRGLLDGGGEAPGLFELLTAGAVLLLILVVATAGGITSWWFSRFAVDDEAVRLHTGVLGRQQRSARLDRVQAVDIVRPPTARIFGFAEVRVEVAGGAGSAIRLAYLRRADAEALQSTLLDRAQQLGAEVGEPGLVGPAQRPEEALDLRRPAGPGTAPSGLSTPDHPSTADGALTPGAARSPGPGAAIPGSSTTLATPAGSRPTGRPVLTVPLPRLLGSVALSTLPPFLVVVLVSVVALAVTGSGATLFGTAPLLLGLGATVWRDVSRGGAWTVETSQAGLRLRHGLLERRTQSIPRGRVQAVRVRQPVLWRFTGWWRMEVNVAGYGLEDGEGGSTRVVPVCSRAQVDELLALVLPVAVDPGDVTDGLTGLTATLDGAPATAGWLCSPRRARLLDPLGWRRQGVLAAREVILVRHGRLSRRLDLVPHGRLQSMAVGRGPLERRMRLVTLVLHSTPGPVNPVAPHLDAARAATFLLAQAARTEAAASAENAPRPAPALPAPSALPPPPSGDAHRIWSPGPSPSGDAPPR